jgi:UbiD family decarboxylase
MQTDTQQPTLRDFLAVLEQHKQLLRIHNEVCLEPDLGAAACALTQMGTTSPAVIFDAVHGYRAAQVVLNVHGSWPNHALAMLPSLINPAKLASEVGALVVAVLDVVMGLAVAVVGFVQVASSA